MKRNKFIGAIVALALLIFIIVKFGGFIIGIIALLAVVFLVFKVVGNILENNRRTAQMAAHAEDRIARSEVQQRAYARGEPYCPCCYSTNLSSGGTRIGGDTYGRGAKGIELFGIRFFGSKSKYTSTINARTGTNYACQVCGWTWSL